jgi:hydroxymethylglutaryl-CoA lyase
MRRLSCLIVASETYQRKNSNLSVEEGLTNIAAMCALAESVGAVAMATIGTSFWCPYEGRTPDRVVVSLVERVMSFGVHQVVLADSIGCVDPEHVKRLLETLRLRFSELKIGLHLHDFTGLALTNVYAGWEAGAEVFECSTGGIGAGIRMPVSGEQMGNVATEDVVHLFHRCGVATGIDLDQLREIGERAAILLQKPLASRLSRGGTVDEFLGSSHQ